MLRGVGNSLLHEAFKNLGLYQHGIHVFPKDHSGGVFICESRIEGKAKSGNKINRTRWVIGWQVHKNGADHSKTLAVM